MDSANGVVQSFSRIVIGHCKSGNSFIRRPQCAQIYCQLYSGTNVLLRMIAGIGYKTYCVQKSKVHNKTKGSDSRP